MTIFSDRNLLKRKITKLRTDGLTIGFVPTMGALHQGHLSLIKMAFADNDVVVVSIFVNPTQFNNADDLKNYPKPLQQDLELLKTVNSAIIVYTPTISDIYSKNIKAEKFNFGGLEHEMEGQFRADHFNGVATVVKRFFEIITPDKAYFGKKDFQQLKIIEALVAIYKLPITIIGGEIYREPDGLAMSSRNVRLSEKQRQAAPFIYTILKTAKSMFGTNTANIITKWVTQQFKQNTLLKLEYFIIAEENTLKPVKRKSKQKTYRAFIAVYAGDIRLIDNIALN